MGSEDNDSLYCQDSLAYVRAWAGPMLMQLKGIVQQKLTRIKSGPTKVAVVAGNWLKIFCLQSFERNFSVMSWCNYLDVTWHFPLSTQKTWRIFEYCIFYYTSDPNNTAISANFC